MKTNINHLIDHTYLKTDATIEQLKTMALEVEDYHFNSLCIRGEFVQEIAKICRTSAVIGFPLKMLEYDPKKILQLKSDLVRDSLKEKLRQTKLALLNGARELDPVINPLEINPELPIKENPIFKEFVAYFELFFELDRELSDLYPDEMNMSFNLKPIWSCELLSEKELEYSVEMMTQVVLEYHRLRARKNTNIELHFSYKNSTGFIKLPEGQIQANLPLIRKIKNLLNRFEKNPHIMIKAAGGIRNIEQALELVKVCDGKLSHIGTSAGIELCK
jgi:deoxyribose-phosphate aldolase